MPLGVLALAFAVAAPAAATSDAPPADMQQLLQSCDAHKFETVVTTLVDGKPKSSKVKLCGTQGQSDEAWLGTLKDAVAKTQANPQMAAEVKQQIVTALNGEIARLTSAVAQPAASLPLPAKRTPPPANSLTRDYGGLPPLPAPALASAAPSTMYSMTRLPRLTLRCSTIGDDRTEQCSTIDRGTVLQVEADEAFPRGVALRFVRRGDTRAEVKLGPMRVGQTTKLRLPAAACKGVVRSQVEIQALSASEPAGTPAGAIGQFDMRC